MKNNDRLLILFILLFTGNHVAFAQTEQQSVLLGGNIGVSYAKQAKQYNFSIDINPKFGYFIVKNLMLGAELSIGIGSNNETKDGKNRFMVFGAFSPVARYYFMKEKVRPFIHAQFGYISITAIHDGDISNLDGIGGGGGLGVDYFMTKNVALECLFRYHGAKFSGLPLQSQFVIGLGLQYYFHPRIKQEMLPQ